MHTVPQPLRFGHHALAVLGATLLAPTILALFSIGFVAVMSNVPVPVPVFIWLAVGSWFATFVLALPGSAIVFSLLWPMTRHGSAAGAWLCVIAGATIGILVAPMASRNLAGASLRQIALFAATGAVIGGIYVVLARRMMQSSLPRRVAAKSFRHRLPGVANPS